MHGRSPFSRGSSRQRGVSLLSVLSILAALGVATALLAKAFSDGSVDLGGLYQRSGRSEAMDQALGIKQRVLQLRGQGVSLEAIYAGATPATRVFPTDGLPAISAEMFEPPALLRPADVSAMRWQLGYARLLSDSDSAPRLVMYLPFLKSASCVSLAKSLGAATSLPAPHSAWYDEAAASLASPGPVLFRMAYAVSCSTHRYPGYLSDGADRTYVAVVSLTS